MSISLKCLIHQKIDICYFYKGEKRDITSRLICHKCLFEEQFPLYLLEDVHKVLKHGFQNTDLPALFNYQIMKSNLDKNFSDFKEKLSNCFERINQCMAEMKIKFQSALNLINQRLEEIIQKKALNEFKQKLVNQTQTSSELHKEFNQLYEKSRIQPAFQYGKDRKYYQKVKDTQIQNIFQEAYNLLDIMEDFKEYTHIHTSKSQLNQIVIDQAVFIQKYLDIKFLCVLYNNSSTLQFWEVIQLQKKLLILFYGKKFKFFIRCYGISISELKYKQNYLDKGEFNYNDSTQTLSIYQMQYQQIKNLKKVMFQGKSININKVYIFEENYNS